MDKNVNKVETKEKVFLTHKPTGITVVCQTERTSLANRETSDGYTAYQNYTTKKCARRKKRLPGKESSSGGHRRPQCQDPERIIFPQGRVTDHRIGLTVYNLNDAERRPAGISRRPAIFRER